MRLAPGSIVPSFSGTTYDGRVVTSRSLLGSPVWLAFYRFASCPFCNLRMHELKTRVPAYRAAGLKLVAVFHSPPAKVAEMAQNYGDVFPIIADPDGELYRTFRVETSLLGALAPSNITRIAQARREGVLDTLTPQLPDGPISRIPADFLMDAHGVIKVAHYGKAISEHIGFKDVDAFLERHRSHAA